MKAAVLFCFSFFFYWSSQGQIAQTVPHISDGVSHMVRYGNNLFIAGRFTSVGGDTNAHTLAMINAHTGALQSWYPAPSFNPLFSGAFEEITSMVVQNGKLIVGGNFSIIAGQNRPGIAIFDAATGVLDPMVPSGIQQVDALWADSNIIYFEGANNSYYNVIRRFDLNTGVVSSWQSDIIPNFPAVYTLAKFNNYIYEGGDDIRRYDVNSGTEDTAFTSYINRTGNGDVKQILPYRNHIYICGYFTSLCGAATQGFLALDSTGTRTAFNINASGESDCMFPDGNMLWVGGFSAWCGGNTNWYAAQIDLSTGAATCWVNPSSGLVGLETSCLYVSGDTVYEGDKLTAGFGHSCFGMSVGTGDPIPPSVTLTASSAVLCSLATDTFSAIGTNFSGVYGTHYIWYQNGNPSYTQSPVYIPPSLADGDSVSVQVISAGYCDASGYSNTIAIHIPPVSHTTLHDVFCAGSIYSFHGISLNQAGTYSDTLSGYLGCDSIVTLMLSAYAPDTTRISQVLCTGGNYNFHGQVLIQPGVYYDRLSTARGCDSIIVLSLSIGSAHITQLGTSCTLSDTLVLSGASFANRIVWQNNGITAANITPDTIYPIGVVVAGSLLDYYGSDSTSLDFVRGICVDPYGYLFVVDAGNQRIQKFPPWTTAGTAAITVAGGNGQGSAANQFNNPDGIVVDGSGTIFVSDISNNRIQKFPYNSTSATNGTTAAGGNGSGVNNNQITYPGDIGLDSYGDLIVTGAGAFGGTILEFPPNSSSVTFGTTRGLAYLYAMCTDSLGDIYIASDNLTEFLAGSDSSTIPITRSATSFNASSMCIDVHKNIYITDYLQNVVLKFPPWSNGSSQGQIVAGGNVNGSSASQLSYPGSVCMDASENLYVAENNSVKKFAPALDTIVTSYIPTTPGTYWAIASFNGCTINSDTVVIRPVPQTAIYDTFCYGSTYNFNGHLIVQDGIHYDTAQSVAGCDSIITLSLSYYPTAYSYFSQTICSRSSYSFYGRTLNQPGYYNDTLQSVQGCDSLIILSLFMDSVFTSYDYQTICVGSTYAFGSQSLSTTGIYVDTFYSIGGCDSIVTLSLSVDSPYISISEMGLPCSLVQDTLTAFGSSAYALSWQTNGSIMAIDTPTISIVAAGNGPGIGPNQVRYPGGMCMDQAGNIYICDNDNSRIQKWLPGASTGITVAGSPTGLQGNAANLLHTISNVFVDNSGNVYIADAGNNRIQKWGPGDTTGITVAGSALGFSGNSDSLLFNPWSMFVDNNGNIYIADFGNNRIQKWAPGAAHGITVAGDSMGAAGTAANLFNGPGYVYVDHAGTMYIADYNNNRVQKWLPGTSFGVTVAGDSTGHFGNSSTMLSEPNAVYIDMQGDVYISDAGNNRIQKWPNGATAGMTVAGGGALGYAYNQIYIPTGVWLDTAGSIYVCDEVNNRVEKYMERDMYIPTSSGVYSASITDMNGCTAVSNAIVLQNSISHIYDTICQGNVVFIGSHSYNRSGIYSDTLIGHNGCDSIIITSLYVRALGVSRLYDTLSFGHSISLGSHIYSRSGIYTDTLNGSNGCDSLVSLYLLVEDSLTFAHIFDTICQGLSVSVGGHMYTLSGSYIDTIRGSLGIDTVISLDLSVRQALLVSVADTICQGSTVTAGGHVYASSGLYVDTLVGRYGCDSIRSLQLLVLPNDSPSISITISAGPSVAGMETDTFTAHYADCINPFFSWYRNGAPLGLHDSIAVVTQVSATDSISCRIDCSNSGRCLSSSYAYSDAVEVNGIEGIPSIKGIRIYPNPNQGTFNIEINASENKEAQVSILDLMGQLVQMEAYAIHTGANSKSIRFNNDVASGIYIIKLSVGESAVYYRMVLER